MRISVIYTGGTIGMVSSPNGLVPGADLQGWLEKLLAGTDLDGVAELTELPRLIDSSNATPADWQAILDAIKAEDADAFVILHGTDTMSYTAAALSYARVGAKEPVVITGSQLPLGAPGSDAGKNVMGALTAASSGKVGGVSLYFGDHLLAGNRTTKVSSWGFEGFASPVIPPLATAGGPWHWNSLEMGATAGNLPKEEIRRYARHDVTVVDLVPGITAQRLRALLTPAPEALIIRAFGVGNCPSDEPGFVDVIKDLVSGGVPVVISSQCMQAEVVLGAYETGEVLAKVGCVGAADMTLEAVYAKLVFLLSQGLSASEIRDWMQKPICGEL
ncbi:L-asparaginase 1 [Actinomyces sp. HMSC064C12]|nr:L-asparaginase 1 [Actinomyces sp. HMSC064C12]